MHYYVAVKSTTIKSSIPDNTTQTERKQKITKSCDTLTQRIPFQLRVIYISLITLFPLATKPRDSATRFSRSIIPPRDPNNAGLHARDFFTLRNIPPRHNTHYTLAPTFTRSSAPVHAPLQSRGRNFGTITPTHPRPPVPTS